ncbi:uncharacterized protein PG986_001395 [Apiospora aurea]|uniref:MARVEL domain-containing protein n=1 Tax=Apiospora aurea TaxID=335848 RepID=A0ABR1QWW1_9PEZI
MAKWGVSSWLVLVRGLQILGVLGSALCNGFLLVHIHVNKLGLSPAMSALEIMTCSILIYTAIVLLVQHTGKRRLRARTSTIVPFVVGDVLFTGLMLGIITVLARTGVPSNCAGLTRSDCKTAPKHFSLLNVLLVNLKLIDKDDDASYDPPDGYKTIRFGDGTADNKGVLDKYCALERAYYFISVAMVFSYMVTVTLSILRICEGMYTRNNVVDERLTTATELYRLKTNRSKIRGMSTTSQTRSPPMSPMSPMSPLRQGVTSSASFPNGPSSQSQERRQTLQHQMPSPPQQHSLTTSAITVAADPAREGLLIDDGQGADHEAEAEAAMVTDGYRPRGGAHSHSHSDSQGSMPALPPYTPGESSRFMVGHGNESNEMRLSDYVKGETRAQREKDHGGVQ